MKKRPPDFTSWVVLYGDELGTNSNIILPGTFKRQDGESVPLVFEKDHLNFDSIAGFAVIHHYDRVGIYCEGYIENRHVRKACMDLIKRGEMLYTTVWADQIQRYKGFIVGGRIQELSIVSVGLRNPSRGKYILSPYEVELKLEETEEDHGES